MGRDIQWRYITVSCKHADLSLRNMTSVEPACCSASSWILLQMHLVSKKKTLTVDQAKNDSAGFAVLAFFIEVFPTGQINQFNFVIWVSMQKEKKTSKMLILHLQNTSNAKSQDWRYSKIKSKIQKYKSIFNFSFFFFLNMNSELVSQISHTSILFLAASKWWGAWTWCMEQLNISLPQYHRYSTICATLVWWVI